MKRLHVHVSVPSLDDAIRFYTSLFGAPPSVRKVDYAKWMLDDPRVNFAISARGRPPGIDHLGIQAEDGTELTDISSRLDASGGEVWREGKTVCCYAVSEKTWARDPAGVVWEAFKTTAASADFGHNTDPAEQLAPPKATPPLSAESPCCDPGR